MRVLRKYAYVVLLSARSNLVYLAEVMSRVVFLGVILYIFSQLWRLVFSQCSSGRLADLTLDQMMWYLTITEAFFLSAPRVSANVDLDVRSGALITYLQRPLSYPMYSLAHNFGERAVRFLMNLLVGSVVATCLVGLPHLSWQGVAFFAISVPLAVILDTLACLLIGLLAFWMEDTSGIFLIYSRMNMILGGMLFPISLFPDFVRKIVEWLPFSSVTYGPAKMLIAPTQAEFLSLFTHQFVGILVFALLVFAVYNQASKRVFVNGG